MVCAPVRSHVGTRRVSVQGRRPVAPGADADDPSAAAVVRTPLAVHPRAAVVVVPSNVVVVVPAPASSAADRRARPLVRLHAERVPHVRPRHVPELALSAALALSLEKVLADRAREVGLEHVGDQPSFDHDVQDMHRQLSRV